MDAIKSVGRRSANLTEGAKEKTSDGMTKDARHFAQDLHRIQDSGVKHLVQKDSEAKDYEKMFKPDIDKFPTRPADMEPSQSVDKYVEYNEAVHMEAKKLSKKDDQKTGDNPDNEDATGPLTNEGKKCGKDCKCKDCKTVAEQSMGGSVPGRILNTNIKSTMNAGKSPTMQGRPAGSPTSAVTVDKKVTSTGNPNTAGGIAPVRPAAPVSKTPGRGGNTGGRYGMQRPEISKPGGSTQQPYGMTIPKKSPHLQAQMDGKITDRKPGGESRGFKPAPGHTVDKPSKVSGPPSSEAGATGYATSKDKNNVTRDKMYTGPAKPDLAKPEKQPYGMNGPSKVPPKPTLKPADGGSKPAAPAPQKSTSQNGLKAPKVDGGAKPGAAKPPAAAPVSPSARREARRKVDKGLVVGPEANKLQKQTGLGVTTGSTIKQKAQPRAKAPAGTNPLKSHYEIEWNGNSYLMNEAQVEALSVFIEKYGINEGTAGEFIKKEMEHPEKLTAKDKKQKIKQSLAIYYSKQRRGENP
jgi:hypothetical protein